jgi:hypothetical protein
MEEPPLKFHFDKRFLPCSPEIFVERLPVMMKEKHILTLRESGITDFLLCEQDIKKLTEHVNNPAFPVLRASGFKDDPVIPDIDLMPLKIKKLSASHTRIVSRDQ